MHYPELNELSHIAQLEGEIWKDIQNYEGLYQISNYGRVKSCARVVMMRNQVKSYPVQIKETIMKAHNDSRGYPQITLASGKRRVARVHRLVAEHFLATPSEELIQECLKVGDGSVWINHKDDNKGNAWFMNLEWCTPSYNTDYSKHKINYLQNSGSKNVNSILSEEDVIEILKLAKTNLSQEKIAAKFGVKQITISNILTGRSWAWLTGIPRKPRQQRYKPTKIMADITCH